MSSIRSVNPQIQLNHRPIVWLGSVAREQDLPLDWLDEPERQRLQRFTHAQAAQRFHLCRAILKSCVSQLETIPPAAVTVSYTRNGKPFLQGANRPFFSISHAGDAVAVALARFPVGLDLELIERRNQPWQRPEVFLHPTEAFAVRAETQPEAQAIRFTRAWTCQEAAVKLLDSSIFHQAARVELAPDGQSGRSCGQTLYFSSWWPDIAQGSAEQLARPPVDRALQPYLLSLAAAEPVLDIQFARWEPREWV